MIGIIHELLFSFVRKNFGEDAVSELKKRAGVQEKQFRLDTDYDDAEWRRIVATALDMAGGDPDEVEKALAHYAGEDLVLRFPGFFKGAKNARDMILRQPVIHNNLATGLSEEARRRVADKFNLVEKSDALVMHYRSPNRHCGLYIGLAEWVAQHFGDKIEIKHDRCMKKGADECEIELRFPGG